MTTTEKDGPTIRRCEEFQMLIQRQSGAYFMTTDAAQTEANRREAEELQRRVALHPRYAYALMRNKRILSTLMEGVTEQRKPSAKLKAYEEAEKALRAEKADEGNAEDFETRKSERLAALAEEHDVVRLRAEHQERVVALLDAPALQDDGETPVQFYRMDLAQLPGWNVPAGTPDDQRAGILGVVDLELLYDLGVLRDPDDAMPAPTPLKKK